MSGDPLLRSIMETTDASLVMEKESSNIETMPDRLVHAVSAFGFASRVASLCARQIQLTTEAGYGENDILLAVASVLA